MNIFHTVGTIIVAGVHFFLQICATIFHGVTSICPGQSILPIGRIGLWITPQQASDLFRAAVRIITQQ